MELLRYSHWELVNRHLDMVLWEELVCLEEWAVHLTNNQLDSTTLTHKVTLVNQVVVEVPPSQVLWEENQVQIKILQAKEILEPNKNMEDSHLQQIHTVVEQWVVEVLE